jgi:hypothetical protein
MASQDQKYQTQWSAQFFAAAELTRRGYLVSFTFGNAKFADLQVTTAQGKHFHVDVKGMSTRNFWLVKKRDARKDHFFVLVYLPMAFAPPQYFILSSHEMGKEMEKQKQHILSLGRKWEDGKFEGIRWGASQHYCDNWHGLPK